MKTVFILSNCDAWHSRSSFCTIGIFSTMKAIVKYLKRHDKLSGWNFEQLASIGQTQCREVNYCIETVIVTK
jgi:hypothetical protein